MDELNSERAEPACPGCAARIGRFGAKDGRCSACRDERLRVKETVRVGPYRDDHGELTRLGAMVHSFKYRDRLEIGAAIGGWLADKIEGARWRDRVEAVVAVPTHWRHRLSRSLYAAEVLTSIVARTTGIQEARVLRRVRGGAHQLGLSYTARRENVRGAFGVRPGVKLHGARLLVIDDVKTTGATLEECAKILRKGGADEVYAAVVVKVPWRGPTGHAIWSI